jgi:hypothetical protein
MFLWFEFKVNTSNGIHDFTLFKILKDVLTLTSHTLLDAPTSNPDLSFKINNILLISISLNKIERILFPFTSTLFKLVFKINIKFGTNYY